jgi:holo-[acyl-carrier protein] synthase
MRLVVDVAADLSMVGVDVQSISEVQASLDEFGARYARRLFTGHEIECCLGESFSLASSYAARFAAKEAVLKILNPREVVPSWKEVEVRELKGGSAEIVLRGVAEELARRKGIVDVSVSVTLGGGLAMAAAVASAETRRSSRG